MAGLLFGKNPLSYDKKDRLDAYTNFITKNKLTKVTTEDINSKTPQELAELVMIHKLKTEILKVKQLATKSNLRQGLRNWRNDKKINDLTETLPEINEWEINIKLPKYFSEKFEKYVTKDTNSVE